MNKSTKICLAIIAATLSFVIFCIFTTNTNPAATRQVEHIIYCEAHLDSICAHDSSFMDTIGETDEYMYLCEAHDKFVNAVKNDKETERKNAYKWYNYWYDKCIKMHMNIKSQSIYD